MGYGADPLLLALMTLLVDFVHVGGNQRSLVETYDVHCMTAPGFEPGTSKAAGARVSTVLLQQPQDMKSRFLFFGHYPRASNAGFDPWFVHYLS